MPRRRETGGRSDRRQFWRRAFCSRGAAAASVVALECLRSRFEVAQSPAILCWALVAAVERMMLAIGRAKLFSLRWI
eukprot:15482738-Alexandrium_andersonii.AAC.1